MRSPLGPMLVNKLMVELELSVILDLANKLNNWRRYVYDMVCYIKADSIDYGPSKLNDFHKKTSNLPLKLRRQIEYHC